MEEYERLTYKGDGFGFYIVLGAILALVLAEPLIEWSEPVLELVVYSLMAAWALYGRLRLFFEARTRGLNQRYVDLALSSLGVMTLAFSLLLYETISRM